MIYATVKMIVEENKCVCDKKIYIYRGDRNIELRFNLLNNRYTVTDIAYAQLIVLRPYAVSLFTEPTRMDGNNVIFMITGDMIDEISETGSYTIQVRLFDDNLNARATLPPCENVLHVENPIIVDESSVVNVALVDEAPVGYSEMVEAEIFLSDGRYVKTKWNTGDIITETKLQKIEEAIYVLSTKIGELPSDFQLPTKVSQLENDAGYLTHIPLDYLTQSDIAALGFLTEIPDAYITRYELEDEGFIKELPDGILTEYNVSEKGYLTEVEMEEKGFVTKETIGQYMPTLPEITLIDAKVAKNAEDISTILSIIDTPPSYTKPTMSLAANRTSIEHNVKTNVTVTPTFRQNDAGAAVSYSLYRDGSMIFTNSTPKAYEDAIKLSHGGSSIYTATVAYSDGVIKNTLLGIAYPSTSIKAGNISASVTVKGYAMSYYGVIDISTVDNVVGLTSTLRTAKGSTLTFNLTNQRIVYMYPSSFGNLTSLKDANNFDYINSYTLSTKDFNGVTYNIYILTDPVTISGFKQIFS